MPQSAIHQAVIVGAGDCGTRAALALRERGFNGEITLIGDEHVEPYERPSLSKQVLQEVATEPPVISSRQQLVDLGIVWRSGTSVVAVDRPTKTLTLQSGETLPYDQLLLATGARARQPALTTPYGVHTLRSLHNATALREGLMPGTRVLVIGGGFIGLEVAATATTRGCRVTVIEFAHRLMSRVVPAAVAAIVQQRHIEAGVDLRCGVGVDRVEDVGGKSSVILTDGTRISADLILAGIGVVPNTELAASAGLTVANGISVNEHLQTDDPAIFAAGDCCSFPHPLYGGQRIRLEAWRNALDHADVAAKNMLGEATPCATVPWFWSDQYELGIQIAGLHAAAAYEVVRSRDDGAEIRFGLDNDGRIVSASGVAQGQSIGRDISLAELMIANRATPRPTELANPAVRLRTMV